MGVLATCAHPRAILPLLCLLATLGLAGCEVKPVKVQLPTFFSAGVRRSGSGGSTTRRREYVRSGHLRIDGAHRPARPQGAPLPDGGCPTAPPSVPLPAPVQVRGDSIVVELDYTRCRARAGSA